MIWMAIKATDSINSIISDVKARVKPDNKVMDVVDKVSRQIDGAIKALGIEADCVKGGSIAKGTFLKNDHDVDLFVRFSMNYDDSRLSDMLERILKKVLGNANSGTKKTSRDANTRKGRKEVILSRVHGSRDYFQFSIDGLDFEVIPVAHIHPSNMKAARNITDFSPMHVTWVASRIEKRPEIADEIRVTKQFCKACKVYGAESYINGFSGHIVDILVIYYGSFISLAKKFASMQDFSIKDPLIVDPEKSLKDPLKQLNASKISPLILVDPVQPERNAAAALREEKLRMFSQACKDFLNRPSKDFFVIRKETARDMVERIRSSHKGSRIVVLDVKTLDGSKDVVGTKVLKVYEDIARQLSLKGFTIISSSWIFDFERRSATIIYAFDDVDLSDSVEREGPPLSSKDDVENFKKKHKQTRIKGNRIYATVARKHVTAQSLIRELSGMDYISSRIKSISINKVMSSKK